MISTIVKTKHADAFDWKNSKPSDENKASPLVWSWSNDSGWTTKVIE